MLGQPVPAADTRGKLSNVNGPLVSTQQSLLLQPQFLNIGNNKCQQLTYLYAIFKCICLEETV